MDDFADLTAGLRDLGGQRVWSLMISLFGDLAQDRGQVIEGPVLSAIMAALQVRPEAARVALHRLRNDGWITSEKSGRISQHSLTAKGRAESAAASPRIYADPTLVAQNWQLVLTPDDTPEQDAQMATLGYTALMPRVYAGPAQATPPVNTLCLNAGKAAPAWLLREIAPQELNSGYAALRDVLTALRDSLGTADDLSPIEIAVLRCLIVHNWRRLVLKHPELPAALVDPGGPAHRCHLLVAELLGRLARPQMAEIEQARIAA